MLTVNRYVQGSDCTTNRSMKVSALTRFMADCEQRHIDFTGDISNFFKTNGIGIFAVSRQLDIVRMPQFGEELTILTYAYEMNPLSGSRNTVIVDEKGGKVALSYSVGAFVDMATGRLVKLPQDYLDRFPYDPQQEMEYLPRKIQIPQNTIFERREHDFRIPQDFIDFYGHTNNANYAVIAMEYIPTDFQIKRVRTEFKQPAVFGDILTVERAETESGFMIALKKDGKIYNLSEFTGQKIIVNE